MKNRSLFRVSVTFHATSDNYWPRLKALGIRYGKEVTLEEGSVIVRRLEYQGMKFETAKDLYDFVTSN